MTAFAVCIVVVVVVVVILVKISTSSFWYFMCLSLLQEDVSPDRPGPPTFAPPPPSLVDQSASAEADGAAPHLAITQPTPSEEDGGGLPTTEDLQGIILQGAQKLRRSRLLAHVVHRRS